MSNNFVKFDEGKLRYDLIPPEIIEAIAKVLTHGATKYEVDNWKKCKDLSRFEASLMRHFEAYRKGEFIDAGSNQPHLAHVLTIAGFLLWLVERDNKGTKFVHNENLPVDKKWRIANEKDND